MKKNSLNKKNYYIFLIIQIILFSGCSLFGPTISSYDSYAYAQATSIKVDALNMMDMATEDYQSHVNDINDVKTKILKMYEYEKHRPKNEFTTSQWKILVDTSRVLGRFINRWKSEVKLRKAYIDDKKENVAFIFDQIAELESKKLKPSDAKDINN